MKVFIIQYATIIRHRALNLPLCRIKGWAMVIYIARLFCLFPEVISTSLLINMAFAGKQVARMFAQSLQFFLKCHSLKENGPITSALRPHSLRLLIKLKLRSRWQIWGTQYMVFQILPLAVAEKSLCVYDHLLISFNNEWN